MLLNRLFNRLFYTMLFFGFFLPSNTFLYIDIFGILFSINEIVLILLPLINYLCTSKNRVKINDRKIKILILLFTFIVVFTEFSKIIIFGESLSNTIKAIRLAIPLISVLVLVYVGIRADIYKVWRTLLWAILISVWISLLSLVVDLPIYGDLAGRGRIFNMNAPFAIIGLYLLFKDKDKWYNYGKLPYFTSLFSIISLVLTFSRSYLIILFLAYVFLLFKTFEWKKTLKFITIPIFIFSTFFIAYKSSPIIEQQVNRRVLSFILEEATINELTIEGNREIIYNSVVDKINKNYWIIGLPLSNPILTWYNKEGFYKLDMHVTDTSIITVLLRYGILPLIILSLIYFRLYKYYNTPIYKYTFLLFLLVSLNVDSLFRGNSVLFLFMVLLVSLHSYNQFEQNGLTKR